MAAIYNLFQASFFINFDRRLGATVDRLTPSGRGGAIPKRRLFRESCARNGGRIPQGLNTDTFCLCLSLSLSPLSSAPLLKTHDGRSRSIKLPSNREYPRRHSVKSPFARDLCLRRYTSKFDGNSISGGASFFHNFSWITNIAVIHLNIIIKITDSCYI